MIERPARAAQARSSSVVAGRGHARPTPVLALCATRAHLVALWHPGPEFTVPVAHKRGIGTAPGMRTEHYK